MILQARMKGDRYIRKKIQTGSFERMERAQSFHIVVLQRLEKKCTEKYDTCAQPLFSSLNLFCSDVPVAVAAREFKKPRWQRRLKRHQTKGLMSWTMAVHVRYKSLYISLVSSAKQQREMTKSCVFWRTCTAMANIKGWFSPGGGGAPRRIW